MRMGCPDARPSVSGPISLAMRETASKSPGDAMGKPASQTSTPIAESCSAIFSFSSVVSVAPGDCSPSRSVVSKMISRLGSNAAKEEAEEEEKEEDNSAARGAARAANVRAAAAAENIDFILKDKCREMTRVIVALLDTPRHTLSRVSNTPYKVEK
jgi:hypothetical protein